MKTSSLAISAALVLTSCSFDVPDLNHPALESLDHPTPSAVQAVATGLLIGARKGVTERVGLVVEWGVLGREALVLTQSDPRFVRELLQSSNLDPGSNNFGGNFWVIPYSNIRAANLLLHAVDSPELVGMTAAQKDGVRGFAKTIQALDYLQVVNAHDTNGAVLDVDRPPGESGPIVTNKDQIFTFIEALLDDGKTRLEAAGATAFTFPLSSGFAGFDKPATFLKFNRALRARVAIYHGKNADALAALSGSFIDAGLPFQKDVGVYHAFGAGSGDLPNVLNTPDILCHTSTVTDAEAGDLRLAAKVKTVESVQLSDHASSHGFSLYPASSSPVPIIRNEELILIRAEANIGLGNVSTAADDLNLIRKNSGGLAERTDLVAGNIVDELLKQRRYSLLFEGGHRWIDLRRHGKLDAAHVALDTAQDVIHKAYPIPLTELQ